jgi:hypothetical protein
MPIAGPSKQKALQTTWWMVARGAKRRAPPQLQDRPIHPRGSGNQQIFHRIGEERRGAVGDDAGWGGAWPQASGAASAARPRQEGEGRGHGQGERGSAMSRKPIMSAAARARARRRALRAEMARVAAELARLALAELDAELDEPAMGAEHAVVLEGRIVGDKVIVDATAGSPVTMSKRTP